MEVEVEVELTFQHIRHSNVLKNMQAIGNWKPFESVGTAEVDGC